MYPHTLQFDKYLFRMYFAWDLGTGLLATGMGRAKTRDKPVIYTKAGSSTDLWAWTLSRIRQWLELKTVEVYKLNLRLRKAQDIFLTYCT